MVDPKDLGKAIQTLRGDRTQKVCAEKVGLSPSSWSLYESGNRNPRKEMRIRLSRGLGVDPQVLEETAWQIRNERITAAESATGQVAGANLDVAADPVLHAVYEHLKGMCHHLQEAMLILYLRTKPPLTP
jgi:transcriptional regulator with XRE-family HTH domain